MGIVLEPRKGNRPLTADELIATLRSAGFEVLVDIIYGKRGVVEQMLIEYGNCLNGAPFDEERFDKYIAEYAVARRMEITHPNFNEGVDLFFTGGDWLFFGECYPTNDDDESRVVMQIASIIGYDARGE
jgi:hypothetical protein